MNPKSYSFVVKALHCEKTQCIFSNVFGIWNENTYNLKINKDFKISHSVANDELAMKIIFYDVKYRNDFKIWYQKYMKFFDDSTYLKYVFPCMEKSMEINGYFYSKPEQRMSNYKILSDQLFFIVNHFEAPVLMVSNGWIFKNEQEASIFKLTYG